jgi:small-conductance mechanosensitive channel
VAYSVVSGERAAPCPAGAPERRTPRTSEVWNVRLAPWDYLLKPFNTHLFPDVYTVTWVATIALLGALVLLYNSRTRALHRHAPYLDMYEWLLWTGISLFGLILVAAVFNFYVIVLLVILFTGLGTMVWVRFVRFPPQFEVYEQKLAKQRYFTRSKFAHPESTIRTKATRAGGTRPNAQRSRANRGKRKR